MAGLPTIPFDRHPRRVMAALVAAIHGDPHGAPVAVDGRVRPGHDAESVPVQAGHDEYERWDIYYAVL
jgi:hypothetical protein